MSQHFVNNWDGAVASQTRLVVKEAALLTAEGFGHDTIVLPVILAASKQLDSMGVITIAGDNETTEARAIDILKWLVAVAEREEKEDAFL